MQIPSLVTVSSLAAAAAFVAAAAAPARDAQPMSGARAHAERYADVGRALREGRHAAAYGRVAALADAGHLPSAQLALLMHDQGRALFGSDWSASLDQRRRWNTLVINAGRQRVLLHDDEGGD